MNFKPLIPVEGQNHDSSPDNLDVLLSAFFRSEMPSRWPAFQRSEQQAVPAGRRRSFLKRSRLALAASLALLVGGYWVLSGAMPSQGPLIRLFKPEAKRPALQQHNNQSAVHDAPR